ncbi:putative ribonuclease H-like domain-containing protein [Tanacetum coccineum]
MNAMTIKMDAQYKELQSRAKQPILDLDDDDMPMSREEEAKAMQTFCSTTSSSSTQNVAFVSSESTNSTNDVSTAYVSSTTTGNNSQIKGNLLHQLLCLQVSISCLQLDHEDLEQLDEFDLEEMDLKWQVAMISMRFKKFHKKLGRKILFDAKELVGFDKTKVECYNCHMTGHFARECISKGSQDSKRRDTWNSGNKANDNSKRLGKNEESNALMTLDGGCVDWTSHSEDEQDNYAFMAFSNSGSDTKVISCSKECVEKYAKLKKLYDEQREQLGDASIEIQAYTQALKIVEAQLVTYKQNQLWYEEKIKFMKVDLDDKTDVLAYNNKLLAAAIKEEKEELKTKVENWQNSSKNLGKLLNTQMSASDKFGLGYGDHRYGSILSYENEVLQSVFMNEESDVENHPLYDRFVTTKGMHAVSPPMTGNYMPSGPYIEIDYSKFTYDSSNSTPKVVSEPMPEPAVIEPKVVSQPKVWTDAPIIKEYESDSDEDCVSTPLKEQKQPSFAKSIQHVKPPRKTVKNQQTHNQSPKVDKKDSNGSMSQNAYLADYKDYNGGPIAFGGSKGYITGKGKIKTRKLDFEDVSFVKELQYFNLFSVSQMCDKKNKVLFTDTECLVLSPEFKLPDENQVLLKVPRQNNMYSFNLENIVPSGGLACLIAKATTDESNMWHRRLGHVNFKNLNKLVKGNLVRGLPSKIFQNDHTCVACLKGKQHKASCKAKSMSSISQPLQLLHMDLFGPTSVRSINHKTYCLVITDDFSRFSWVFFLRTKDKTSAILKDFIRQIENQLNKKVKTIRCDNGTEFKNRDLIEFCGSKGINREYSNARTPQQNGVAERKNRTLIEAAITMLADSFLPNTFWAEVVSTACYVLNRVLVTKPQNKTPYELITGKQPIISYIRPFGCHVTILNTIDQLGKFEEKANEGFLVGDKPTWLFDLDYLTDSMNYQPVRLENQANKNAGPQESNTSTGTQDSTAAGNSELEDEPAQEYYSHEDEVLKSKQKLVDMEEQAFLEELERLKRQEKEANDAAVALRKELDKSTEDLLQQAGSDNATSTNSVSTASAFRTGGPSADFDDLQIHALEDIYENPSEGVFTNSSYDDEGAKADFTNLENTMNVSPIPTSRIHIIHPQTQILGDLTSAVQIRSKIFKGKEALGTKWVYRNKKDKRRVVVRNKARLVALGYRQEEGIYYEEFQQKFDETFYEAWDRFNDLLRGSSRYGFSELHQLDTFYNALNSNDQDSLNSAAGGNFLDKMPRECLKIIESKSKVRQSRSKAIVSKVSTSSSTPAVSSDVAELKDMVRALILDKKNQTPAPVKAVEQSCVTCGGGHSYQNCPATDGNIYCDNIQE